ncbi:MAG: biotin-dependent carboxyltransferase family protein, partial [Gemmatimonadaceae bacterium]|nr:biotin-dependent carboxyltransferase family protein [Gemmatimonadaceae bacterium]
GWMDDVAPRLANALVGNAAEAPVLECTLLGPTLRLAGDALVAITGMPMAPTVDGQAVPQERPLLVRAGSVLTLAGGPIGCRAYIAVSGGIAVPRVLDSASTHLRSGFGGHAGRALRRDDVLATGTPSPVAATLLARPDAVQAARHAVVPPPSLGVDAALTDAPLGVLEGDDVGVLADRDALRHGAWTVSLRSDRMGLRLDGTPLAHARATARASEGTTWGTIQLPPDGLPIVLGVDRQVTGGYPVIGRVAQVHRATLAQRRPGASLRFTPITLADAQQALRARETALGDAMADLARTLHRLAHA